MVEEERIGLRTHILDMLIDASRVSVDFGKVDNMIEEADKFYDWIVKCPPKKKN